MRKTKKIDPIRFFLMLGVLLFVNNPVFSMSGKFVVDLGVQFPGSFYFDNSYSLPDWQHPYGYISLENIDNSKGKYGLNGGITYFFCPGSCQAFGINLNVVYLSSEVDFLSTSRISLPMLGGSADVTNEWGYRGNVDSYLINLNLVKKIPINYFHDNLIHITIAAGPTLMYHSIDLYGSLRESFLGYEYSCDVKSSEKKYDLAWNVHVDIDFKIMKRFYIWGGFTKYWNTKISAGWSKEEAVPEPGGATVDDFWAGYSWNAEIKKCTWTVGIRLYL
ncbi:MAG: hypothetical protein KAW12_20840 [Candidatus Aminicenantes bacterium]|nr:hypothetical protein [Candidatus Aminicenantes bacterium]